MGRDLSPRLIRPTSYLPTVPRSGSTSDAAWFRMKNALIKGLPPLCYTQAYSGSANLGETIPTSDCTGTVAVNGTTTVTGTATTFIADLRTGQRCYIVDAANNRGALLAVEKVVSDTVFICSRAPDFTASGLTLVRLPVIYAIDKDRFTQIRGNGIQLNKGSILPIGFGEVLRNGASFTATITASDDPSIALYDSTADTYAQFPLGMDQPAPPTLAAAAGTKGMQGGMYTVVITPERIETLGYNNPSDRSAAVTIATNQAIDVTYPAMDTANGQNAWGVWVTTFSESLGTTLDYLNGPWFRLAQSTGSSAGYTETIEWLDAEVERNTQVTFNNDPPPDAGYVAIINNGPVWIACDGATADPAVTTYGPWIFPVKPDNIEAAPAELAFSTSPSELILGVISGNGRLYFPTTGHLQVALGTPASSVPVIIQPYWKAGFKNEAQIILVDDVLYGFPTDGPSRSSANVTLGEQEVWPDSFAADVQEIVDPWIRGHVLVAHDPVNNAVCFFHAANDLNDDGYWTTRILVFGLKQNGWIGEVLLSESDQDMIVTSVATVSGNLDFLCGGRQAGNAVAIGTYQFDVVSGDVVQWAAAAPYSDLGDELRSHVVKRIRATYESQDASLGVFGYQPTEVVDVDILDTGNSASLTGAVALPAVAGVALSQQFQINCPNLDVSTIQIEGEFGGSGNVDRCDEILVQAASQGVRR